MVVGTPPVWRSRQEQRRKSMYCCGRTPPKTVPPKNISIEVSALESKFHLKTVTNLSCTDECTEDIQNL